MLSRSIGKEGGNLSKYGSRTKHPSGKLLRVSRNVRAGEKDFRTLLFQCS